MDSKSSAQTKSRTDATIAGLLVAAICLFGTTIAFVVLWRIAIDDGDGWRDLYNKVKDIDIEDNE